MVPLRRQTPLLLSGKYPAQQVFPSGGTPDVTQFAPGWDTIQSQPILRFPKDVPERVQVAIESDEQEFEATKRAPLKPPVQEHEPAALAARVPIKNRDMPRRNETINIFFFT